MSQKKKAVVKTVEIPTQAVLTNDYPSFLKGKQRLLAALIFIVAFSIYFNTFFNEYALDDGIVITENEYTKAGFNGIKDILSHESFSGVAGVNNELAGGRYRPLSVVSFAMEYGIFGEKPSVSHLVNALLYGLVCVLLFRFLRQVVFKENILASLIATLLFAAHPLHTDVVSNIKGRDEILALLLLLVCVSSYHKYVSQKRFMAMVGALAAFFFSLLAKENGITFIAVIPMLLYFFYNKTIRQSLLAAFPFVIIFVVYLFMRLNITGIAGAASREVMNSPFLFAQGDQELATKIMILGKDLLMLVYPHPLSFDYSYNQIPYVHFSDWKCIASLIVNTALIIIAVALCKRRHILSFCILFYYATLSIVSNFAFEVGSPFNERFLFQPSIGFAIALAYIIVTVFKQKESNAGQFYAAISVSALLVLAGAVKTIARNPDWKNNDTLFIADAVHAPFSAKTTSFAGVAYLKRGEQEKKDSLLRNRYFDTAVTYFRRALKIYPGYADAFIDLGVIYIHKNMLDSSKVNLMKAKAIYPDNNVLNINIQYLTQQYNALAVMEFESKNLDAAIAAINSSLECTPDNVSALYNLGGYYLNQKNIVKAREVWSRALQLDPNNTTIKGWLDKISGTTVPQ